MPDNKSSNVSPVKDFIAGGFGGMCLVIAGHPFDTIKVRLQTMPVPGKGLPPMYASSFDCFKKTFVNEGIRGFYKGMAAPTMMVTPNYAVLFFSYGLGKTGVNKLMPGELTPVELFMAGAFAGKDLLHIVVSSFNFLLRFFKERCTGKASGPGQILYAGPIDCAKQLLRTGGIGSLYRGLGATFVRAIPQAGLYFMTYEMLKKAFTPADGSNLSPLRTMTAGGLTGIINWVFMLPADVVKSRIQTAPEGTYPKGFRDAFPKLLKAEGVRGLYRGIVPVFIRAFPANAACFTGFEAAIKVLDLCAPNL